MDQPTFHAIYEQMPEDFKAELIGGIVYVPAALRADHGDVHADVITWLGNYRAHTPGVRLLDNATHKLGKDSEPQPDASLLIRGGQTTVTDKGYIRGAPELVVEVVLSTRAYDLHAKKNDYEKYGVREYIAVIIRECRIVWFIREDGGGFIEMPVPSDGIFRSPLFAGLWLDMKALLEGNLKQVLDVLTSGLGDPSHATFVATLKS